MDPRTVRTAIWAGVVTLGILIGGIVAMIVTSRGDTAAREGVVQPLITALITALAAALPAIGAWRAAARHSEPIARIEDATNGRLTARLDAAREATVAQVREELIRALADITCQEVPDDSQIRSSRGSPPVPDQLESS